MPKKRALTFDEEVENRLHEYKRQYTPETAVDEAQLQTLAGFDVQIVAIQQKMADQISGKETDTDEVKTLATTVSQLSREARLIAKGLGIDRTSRQKKGGGLEMYLPQLADRASRWLDDAAIQIMCRECIHDPGRVFIPLGTIIWHFIQEEREWSWQSACPRCGKEAKIGNDNWRGYTFKALKARLHELEEQDEEADEVEFDDGD